MPAVVLASGSVWVVSPRQSLHQSVPTAAGRHRRSPASSHRCQQASSRHRRSRSVESFDPYRGGRFRVRSDSGAAPAVCLVCQSRSRSAQRLLALSDASLVSISRRRTLPPEVLARGASRPLRTSTLRGGEDDEFLDCAKSQFWSGHTTMTCETPTAGHTTLSSEGLTGNHTTLSSEGLTGNHTTLASEAASVRHTTLSSEAGCPARYKPSHEKVESPVIQRCS
ncbi:unknown (plasmid) [Haloarcula marismortui ATCC 43049]|uniref:Uncharacterized protein n=1 Tax=Haloarcula marismortui (strain ATCC 43049 / DSM 3752 / JCM 8966 / VKM B-1809) TaxID=272569 RepID=Q5V7I4_HALMA|nr:unknown [Haloarcula marismortui ATCC 43049]